MDETDTTRRDDARTLSGREPARPSWFRRVTFHSLLAGLCPLIPVPFLDDRVLAGVKRRMVRELAAERGIALDAARVDLLAGTRGAHRGCLGWIGWVLYSLTVRLLGKLFRKILILFAVKESVDTASHVFHEGYLLHLTFAWAPAWKPEAGSSPDAAGLTAARARTIHRAIETTLDAVDPRPLEQTLRRSFRGSRRLLRRGARLLARSEARPRRRRSEGAEAEALRETHALREAEERRLLGGLLDRLVADLWEERGYLTALEERYRLALAAPSAEGADRPDGSG